jgi:hypothetical protein
MTENIQKHFNQEDKRIMRAHIRQKSVVILVVALIGYPILLAALLMIENTTWSYVLIISSPIAFAIFCWKYLHKPVSDLKTGIKINHKLKVDHKHVNTRYAWHGTLAWSSPQLQEFYFTSKGKVYVVAQDFTRAYNPGNQ